MTRAARFGLLVVLAAAGCDRLRPAPQTTPAVRPTGMTPAAPATLADARKGFTTKLVRKDTAQEPVPAPPPKVFRTVTFDAPPGPLAAYLTPDPADGKTHPAIVWITGGDCNTIGDVWTDQKPSNDQTAAAFRRAGVVMMFPSLRGGNQNPGVKESFLGEVDDVIAAADFLAKQPYIDPARIYLGGHSTGGTLVLLVSECTDRFRAVFSFGPVDNPAGYGADFLPFDTRNPKELELRSPGRWLAGIKSPTFVFEGTARGNFDSLQAMARASSNPNAHFYPVRGADHFSLLAPLNRMLADKVLKDDGPACGITVTEDEVAKAVRR